MRSVSVSDRLKSLRAMADLSASELATLAGMVRTHVSLIEKGDGAHVQAKTLAAMARVLGVSIDWLYLGKGDEPTPQTVKASVAKARRSLGNAA